MTDSQPNSIYHLVFTVSQDSLDQNGHVNNVFYLQWMQDIAMRHYEHMGGLPPTLAIGATWVVRSHQIVYLSPAFAGDQIEVRTWVVNLRRVRSLRRYEFIRESDDVLLVRGETDWVFVDAKSGSPRAIPAEISSLFTLLPDKRG